MPAPPAAAVELPFDDNERVRQYVQLFQTSRRRNFERGLINSRRYEARMKAILVEEGVPAELYYLALIESGYNHAAYSRARAMGIWQFIESTGRIYGLRHDWWVDERRDPERATRAAARHLGDLYRELGSWPLALAGYNCGINRVRREIERSGTRDFWKLSRLPAQTRNYVPAFMAAALIARSPEQYGFAVAYEPALEYELVEVEAPTSLEVVAACAATTVEVLQQLNPHLRRGCTPPSAGAYALAVPVGTAETFRTAYTLLPPDARVNWRQHQIAKGDTLAGLARRYGTTVAALAELNRLKASSVLRAGESLLVPVPAGPSTAKASSAPGGAEGAAGGDTYRVREGDSLWSIARRHGVSVAQLQEWNPWVVGRVFHPGDLLAVSAEGRDQAGERGERPRTYQVRRGDTLWSIARRFETDVDDLRRLNRLGPATPLQPGRRLTIPAAL